ncbi:hypothetical protein RHGRI_035881 [Rhododendron griersonianum]|uniref:Uncharacterized protein n=1 Tax=Rhododendron griersonianum TaxID=479676 RepID=A0AAV6HKT4_9ERIC|nr:hypothetical protein RHGRI_035881 [Rhododendron griersonianum]
MRSMNSSRSTSFSVAVTITIVVDLAEHGGDLELFYDENDEAVKSRQIHYDDSAIDRLLDREQIGDKAANMDEAEEDGFLKAFKAVKSRQIHYDDVAIDRLLDREQIGDKGANLDEAEEDGFFKAFKVCHCSCMFLFIWLSTGHLPEVDVPLPIRTSKHPTCGGVKEKCKRLRNDTWQNLMNLSITSFQKVRGISINNKETEVLKRKQNHKVRNNAVVGGVDPEYTHGFRKGLDEDTSNRSSSGFAIANSDSCVLFGSAYASDLTDCFHSLGDFFGSPSSEHPQVLSVPLVNLTNLSSDACINVIYTFADPSHSVVWDTMRWSFHISVSYEEDFLFASYASMVSFEIGPGSILIRFPSSIAREQESEANSLSVENERHPPNKAIHIWPPFLLIFL